MRMGRMGRKAECWAGGGRGESGLICDALTELLRRFLGKEDAWDRQRDHSIIESCLPAEIPATLPVYKQPSTRATPDHLDFYTFLHLTLFLSVNYIHG